MAYSKLCITLLTVVIFMLAANPDVAVANEATDELQRQIDSLVRRIEELEKRAGQSLNVPPAMAATGAASAGNGALQIGLSGLFAGGGSSVDNDALSRLQGGAHDPNQNGFVVQNVELSIGATVDPYFDAKAHLIFQIDSDGETVVELEEAFFTTRSLPGGLQIKGGQYFTEFGRQNKRHPHSWSFVDQPVVLSRFFGGDGLRGQGARLSWLTPTDWYSELIVGLQNAKGETMTSFLNAPGEEIGGHTLLDRDARRFGDLLYTARWLNGFDLSDTISMNLGVSGLWGPNASGDNTDTRIVGTDWYMKWLPARTQRGFPFVSWHTEVLWRQYEAGDLGIADRETLRDWGMFTQALWGFKPGWVAGLRWEYATADGDTATDPLRDTRKRLSPNLTWYPTEYSKLRLQYSRDWTEHLVDGSADTLWLQVEFGIGSHAAHVF
ncbi:MAG: zinc-regulated TonB-dependent outer membrane receptor [Proteobacteria bacterium]|nr:zinc-regulated TonB-dependent outer membrane receptor [Pseudomonadota bacterium]